jgi:hypothetical protein
MQNLKPGRIMVKVMIRLNNDTVIFMLSHIVNIICPLPLRDHKEAVQLVKGSFVIDVRKQELMTEHDEIKNRADTLQRELLKEVSRLNRFSTRGIMALALFLIISLLAWNGFLFLPAPDTVTAALGPTPPARFISIALLLYTFSAIILSLSRMTAGIEHRSSFSHVGYLTVFFIFFYFSKSLEDNFLAVFGSGITILGVESYRIWTYCSERIAQKKEDLEFITRTGRPPPVE